VQRPTRVLIIDDDDELREAMRGVLVDAGYRVECAADAKEGLTLLRSLSEPCLVLLDLIMPVMNGWQFRAALEGDPLLSQSPVVVMAATSSLEQAAIDADALLPKPVHRGELLAMVARFADVADLGALSAHAPADRRRVLN
jgi:CheY-like chemotaxis protein